MPEPEAKSGVRSSKSCCVALAFPFDVLRVLLWSSELMAMCGWWTAAKGTVNGRLALVMFRRPIATAVTLLFSPRFRLPDEINSAV